MAIFIDLTYSPLNSAKLNCSSEVTLLNLVIFRGAPDARVITLSSAWHKHGVIHWDDPDYAQPQHRKYRASEAYSQSKLANVLFTRELARRLEGTGVNA